MKSEICENFCVCVERSVKVERKGKVRNVGIYEIIGGTEKGASASHSFPRVENLVALGDSCH